MKECKAAFKLNGNRFEAARINDSRIGARMIPDEYSASKPFWRSALGIAVIGFLAAAAFLLVAEHRAHIFVGNWFIWLLPLVCVGMHFFHGGHGRHGGHDGTSSKDQ